MPYSHQQFDPNDGFMSGYLAAKSYNQDARANEVSIKQDELENQKKEADLLAQKSMHAAVDAMGDPEVLASTNPLKFGTDLAAVTARYGDPTKAAEILAKVASMRSSMATADATDFKSNMLQANIASELLAQVHDIDSLGEVTAKAVAFDLDPKGVMRQIYKQMKETGYNEEGMQLLRQEAMSAKDRAMTALHKSQLLTDESRRAEIDYRTNVVLPAQVKNYESMDRHRQKQGGVDTKSAAADRKYAESLIGAKYNVGKDDKPAVFISSRRLVDLAEDIRQHTPGLDRTAAMNRAFDQLDKQHEFAGLGAKETDLGSRHAPKPLPAQGNKLSAGDLVKNEVYAGQGKYQGHLMRWNGTGFDDLGSEDASAEEEYDEPEADDEDEE